MWRKPVDRKGVLDRDGHRCRRCGVHWDEARGLEVHHIVPVVVGDNPALANLAALCRPCHKGAPCLSPGEEAQFEAWCNTVPSHVVEVIGQYVPAPDAFQAAQSLIAARKAFALPDRAAQVAALAAAGELYDWGALPAFAVAT